MGGGPPQGRQYGWRGVGGLQPRRCTLPRVNGRWSLEQARQRVEVLTAQTVRQRASGGLHLFELEPACMR